MTIRKRKKKVLQNVSLLHEHKTEEFPNPFKEANWNFGKTVNDPDLY